MLKEIKQDIKDQLNYKSIEAKKYAFQGYNIDNILIENKKDYIEGIIYCNDKYFKWYMNLKQSTRKNYISKLNKIIDQKNNQFKRDISDIKRSLN